MVRGNLRLWTGIGVFAVLVVGLALVALGREEGIALHGHWRLALIETPEGSFVPEDDNEWIEFDDGAFHGRTECFDFDGEFTSREAGEFELNGHGWAGGCAVLEGTSYAFDQYFGNISRYEFTAGGLTLESEDASVQFLYIPEGG